MSGGVFTSGPASRAARFALVLCLAAAMLGLVAAERSTAAADIGALRAKAERKLIKAVKKKLPKEQATGLIKPRKPVKVKVKGCDVRGSSSNFGGFVCRWSAKGELPGRVLLRCNGKAKIDAGIRKARVKRCKNLLEAQAPLLKAPHGVDFGYFEDFTSIGGLVDDASAAATGSNTIREGITWTTLQPDPAEPPASWRWGAFDAFYAEALAAGLRPVFTFRNAPCWAAAQPCGGGKPNPPAPDFYDEYAFAAAEIAKRYPQALAIEIWFEPNSLNFWGQPADPAAFSALVGQAADAIHAVPGNAVRVYSGGLAPGAKESTKIEYGKFLDAALDAGGIQRADAVAFHAVTEVPFKPGMNPTNSYLGRLRIQTQTLRAELADHGAPRPIAFTQLSYSTGAATYPYTEAQQAEALTASYELIRRIPDTESVIVARLLDNGDGSKVQGFGVIRSDGSRKAAYCSLARARGVAAPPGC